MQTSGAGWPIAAVVLVALAIAIFGRGLRGPALTVTVIDDAVVRWLTGLHAPGLTGAFGALAALSSWWALYGLLILLVLVLLVLRRFRHLIVWLVVVGLLEELTADVISAVARRPRPFGVPIQIGWGGWALPSLQLTLLTSALVASLYTLVPEGRWRSAGKWVVTGVVVLVELGRLAMGVDAPSDAFVAAVIGVAVPLLAFRLFTPNEVFPISYRRGRSAHLDIGGARGAAIRTGLEDHLGLVVEEVKPFGLSGSAGSTPLRITLAGDSATSLFGKLYARSHLRADRWYKLGRELLYGRLEDEKPFNSVRRLVQQEDYALRLCRDAGLPSPTPFGVVELTPEREYMLVTEFFEDAVELGTAEVDDQLIDDGLRIVRRLWDAGLAHRDIKPANLLVRDGRMLLIDVAFVETHPSPWRQAVDLANMMLCLALRSRPEQVFERARRQFSVEEISEAFAAARGLALPSQLRRMLRAEGHDLHAQFVNLLPKAPDPVSIQRWTLRRIGLLAGVLVLAVFGGAIIRNSVSNAVAVRTPINVRDLGCTHYEPLWLQAQAVPSASLVPCVRTLPAGWTLAGVAVNSGRSVITLDHDRAGKGAMETRLTEACDIRGATAVVSQQPGVRRYLQIHGLVPEFRGASFDVFPGGCVTTRFTVSGQDRAELTGEAPFIVALTTRRELREALEVRSGGRLHLDPQGAR